MSALTPDERSASKIKHHVVVAIYKSYTEAENTIKDLHHSGFDMKKLSVVGVDFQTTGRAQGYYSADNRLKCWGTAGTFWGSIWGVLSGSAFFLIPGIGSLLIAGPLVGGIVGMLEGALMIGGLSALGAGLYNLGVPKERIVKYEIALKSGRYVLIAHGTGDEIRQAQDIIDRSETEASEEHPFLFPAVEAYVVAP